MDSSSLSWAQWRHRAIHTAQAAGIPASEVDRFLEWRLGWSRLDQQLGRCPPDPGDWEQIEAMWQARVRDRVPLQHLLGQARWRDLELGVTAAVLIPRPETELLVDLALDWLRTQPPGGIWLDMGTGSGALAIALAREHPQLGQIYAVDLSPAALTVARANAERYSLTDRIVFREGSWFTAIPDLRGQIQGMVANPPYIPSHQIPHLPAEVRCHEPHLALDGGATGLKAIEHLSVHAPPYLQPGGFWAVEVMAGQSAAVVNRLIQTQQYTHIQCHQDLAGIDRIVSARKGSA